MDIRERIKNVIVKNLIESKLEEEGVRPEVRAAFLAKKARERAVAQSTNVRSKIHKTGTSKASRETPVRPSRRNIKSPGGGKEGIPGLES